MNSQLELMNTLEEKNILLKNTLEKKNRNYDKSKNKF